jgi:hypothetical protein
MRAESDPDLLLIERMLAPPPLEDARTSLEFWQTRRKSLPLYRVAARREAKAMVVRCKENVRAAERARFEASPVGRLLAAIGISSIWWRRARSATDLGSWLLGVFTLRTIKLVVGSAVLSLFLMGAAVTVLIVLLVQLA